MTQFLNLDEFETKIDKRVKLNGVTHEFQPFSVEDFIDQLKEMEDFTKREEVPVSEYMTHMVGIVHRAFPTIPEDELRKLSMPKLKKLTDFVRGETEAEALAGLPAEEAEEAKNG